jgi:predicted secreted Zn-dependent protease
VSEPTEETSTPEITDAELAETLREFFRVDSNAKAYDLFQRTIDIYEVGCNTYRELHSALKKMEAVVTRTGAKLMMY